MQHVSAPSLDRVDVLARDRSLLRQSVRRGTGTVAAVALVSAVAAFVAFAFRESVLAVGRLLTGAGGPVEAARRLGPVVVFLLVSASVCAAAWAGAAAQRHHAGRLGLRAIAASARGEEPDPSARGTALRMGATWIATSALGSLGREAPIMEAGGMVGNGVGRLSRRSRHRLAVTGIAAAFAVAYHAPIAAVLYAEEHLGVRHDRRTVAHAVTGAALGFAVAQTLLGGHPIFPRGVDPMSRAALVLALVCVLPAYAASRTFLWLRQRLERATSLTSSAAALRWRRVLLLAIVAGAIVAFVPLTAGNGMEAVRSTATTATAGVALALCLGKLVATSATIGTGAPGGVVSPSLAVSAGAALGAFLLLGELDLHLGGSLWDGILIAMAIGVAVSVRAPLVAVVMLSEMAGDFRLLPLSALAVVLATGLDRLVDCHLRARNHLVPATLHDEDA